MAIIERVIKYEGDNRTFVWKHPEGLQPSTQLIVHESQAVFFTTGKR